MFDHKSPFLVAQWSDITGNSLYGPTKSTASESRVFPNIFEQLEAFQRQGIIDRLSTMMGDERYQAWSMASDDQIIAIIMEIQAQIEANSPPIQLPDGTPIDPYNCQNDTTLKYFQEHIQNDQMVNPTLEYMVWTQNTYGKTEWRKNVEMADSVVRGFGTLVIKEVVMDVVGTMQFVFRFAMDPENTTQEVVNAANYLIQNPEVVWEAVKKLYKDFNQGSPEHKAEMLGIVSSFLYQG
ncbi:hypothetical protein RE628_05955 [Paenibacillus sp. D2_2]|uniref:hypothetical protein n=1 Tax=Paenibacillus sp. D2_2 TaxID=3073092 RepID=UPI0028160A7E|nr:hypothetical protein [Paenibacillus sp. D2_2]WMT41981.1 hypothetical protein RE628_05955 [Paenibacillus sp. D2_2]